jgi:hypothetical protein
LEIVTGNSLVVNTSTVGINTYSPVTENYVLDINGPVYLHHGEVMQTFSTNNAIYGSVYRSNIISLVGFLTQVNVSGETTYLHPVYTSIDNGVTFYFSYCDLKTYIDTPIDIPFTAICSLVTGGYTYLFVGAKNGYCYYSKDLGYSWNYISLPFNNLFISNCAILLPDNATCRIYSSIEPSGFVGYINDNFIYFDIPISTLNGGGSINISSYTGFLNPYFSSIQHVVADSSNYIYLLGNDATGLYGVLAVYEYTIPSNYKYLDNSHFISANSQIVLAPNNVVVLFYQNLFYYNSLTQIGTVPFTINPFDSVFLIQSAYVFDTMNSVVVGQRTTPDSLGQSGFVYYSNDGFTTFQSVPLSMLNSKGNSFQLLKNPLSHIFMPDLQHFVLLNNASTYNQSFYCYLPDIFTSTSNLVMDITGLVNVTGNVDITNMNASYIHVVDASFNGNVDMNYYYSVTGNVNSFHGNTIIGNNTTVTGYSYLYNADISNLTVYNNMVVTGNVSMNSSLNILGNLTVASSSNLANSGILYQNGDSYFSGNVHLQQPLIVDNFVVSSSVNNVGYTVSYPFSSNASQTSYNANDFSLSGSSYVNGSYELSLTSGVWLIHSIVNYNFNTSDIRIDSIGSCFSSQAYIFNNFAASPLFIERIPSFTSLVNDVVEHDFTFTYVCTKPINLFLNTSLYSNVGGSILTGSFTLTGNVQCVRIA